MGAARVGDRERLAGVGRRVRGRRDRDGRRPGPGPEPADQGRRAAPAGSPRLNGADPLRGTGNDEGS